MKRKSKLIFMFETNENGIMVTTKVKGKLKNWEKTGKQ